MTKNYVFISIFIFTIYVSNAQNIEFAKQTIQQLSSEEMYGRGYVRDGHLKAANFIANQFQQLGLKPFKNKSYFQYFSFPINTFPGKLELKADRKTLKLGESYIISPFSESRKGIAKIQMLDSNIFYNDSIAKQFLNQNFKKKAIIYNEKHHDKLIDLGLEYIEKVYSSKAILKIQDTKLTASLSTSQYSNLAFEVLSDSLKIIPKKVKFDVEAEFKQQISQNVIGFVQGSEMPDSFIVFTAHYDHLGGQGDIYFPGANDNAAGIAMLLDLANHYAQPQNKPKQSIVFMAFSGEEAGLLGSKFYTANPLFGMRYIQFLINLDLVGTGSNGATVVNGTVFTNEFEKLQQLNAKNNYLPQLKSRGKAANSDHYFFTEEGVPAFFIYMMGGPAAYHDVHDIYNTLPLTKYESFFKLMLDFVNTF